MDRDDRERAARKELDQGLQERREQVDILQQERDEVIVALGSEGLLSHSDVIGAIGKLRADVARLTGWAGELRDRIRDIYLNTTATAMRRDDVAGEDICSAEKECRIRHQAILRGRSTTPTQRLEKAP